MAIDQELIVDLSNVTKSFGKVPALTDATIQAPAGSITVLLGPNGAGKTTATRLITGALNADQGMITVFGLNPAGPMGENVRRRCGVVTAKPSLYDRLSGFDNMLYAAELFGLKKSPDTLRKITEAAERFDIQDSLKLQVGGFSTGMKTRLALARSLLHNPDLLLFDEPTSGLDPEAATAVLGLIRTMTAEGRTVVMCTHLLLEAEGLADQIVMIENGHTIVSGRPHELGKVFWPNPKVSFTAEIGADLDQLATAVGVESYERQGNTGTFTLSSADIVSDLILEMSLKGIRLKAVEPYIPSLEDLYFAIRRSGFTNRSIQEMPTGVANLPAKIGADR
jgi:ABC-2 type transport system ATP-binding protein